MREEHGSFYEKFKLLLPEESQHDSNIETLVKSLSLTLSVTESDWQIGHSKVFLRRNLALKLERLAHLKVSSSARIIQHQFIRMRIRAAGSRITNWASGRLHANRRFKMRAASNLIASRWRMKVQYERLQVSERFVETSLNKTN